MSAPYEREAQEGSTRMRATSGEAQESSDKNSRTPRVLKPAFCSAQRGGPRTAWLRFLANYRTLHKACGRPRAPVLQTPAAAP